MGDKSRSHQGETSSESTPDKEERRRWRQHGIDETGFGAESGFFITLKLPKDPRNRRTFVTTLWQACAEALANIDKQNARVEFTLPIEPKSPTQILIKWKAKKLPKRKSGRKRKP